MLPQSRGGFGVGQAAKITPMMKTAATRKSPVLNFMSLAFNRTRRQIRWTQPTQKSAPIAPHWHRTPKGFADRLRHPRGMRFEIIASIENCNNLANCALDDNAGSPNCLTIAAADCSNASNSVVYKNPVPGTNYATFQGSSGNNVGWTVGGGLEYALGNNWTVKGEYLYVDLDNHNRTLLPTAVVGTAATGASFSDTGGDRFSVARVGINYKFGGPVVAKY
jgi:Outer membrane protein beta-barrel domain